MFKKGYEAHLKVMTRMKELMKSPIKTQKWVATKQKEFEALPSS